HVAIMSEQAQLQLEQTKANAWPNVRIGMSKSFIDGNVEKYKIRLVNRGIGPAIIEGAVVAYNGEPTRTWSDFYRKANLPDSIRGTHSNSMIFDLIIPSNGTFTFVDWSHNKALREYLYSRADKISIKVCYKSVYGDYWTVERKGFKNNLEKNIRTKIEQCQFDTEVLFEE
ncbi:MAG: hypothetical protein AAFU67_17660, partial [Bacteroidota bacterium]